MSINDNNKRVQVESELEELIPGFIKNRHKDIEKIERMLLDEDFEAIKLVGHTMKGNGTGYGFKEISELGESIEKAAREKQIKEIRRLIGELNLYLENVVIEYI